ncbi:MAG: SbcC/MukB-like Walker B domain-containing protein [Anaerolineae bacterium]
MIPNRLRVRNFMCYGEGVPELDFSGIRVAGLVGENGHGKSALLDAITWALWGRARTHQDDRLIRQGEVEMEVDLEFTVEGQRYRVIRKRVLSGRAGRTDLQLQAWTGEAWQLLTEASKTQTEQRILSILRLNYETFVNSAFLVQGGADRFTTQPPAERKRILGEILGLGQYDEYQRRARERARAFREMVQRLDAEMGEADRELAHEPLYRAQEQEAAAQVKALEEEEREADRAFRGLEAQVRVLEERAWEVQDLSRRLEETRRRLQAVEKRLQEREARYRDLQALLARREEIRAGLRSLEEARGLQRALLQRMEQQRRLTEEKNDLERRLLQARHALEREASTVRDRWEKAQERARAAGKLQAEVERLRAEVARLREAQQEQEALQGRRQALLAERASLEEAMARLQEEVQALRERVGLLQAATEPRCPLCRKPLSPEERARLVQEMEQEVQAREAAYWGHKERLNALARETKEVQERLARAAETLRGLAPLERQLGAAEQSLQQAREAQEEAAVHQEHLRALEGRLAREDFAPEVKARLAQVEAALAECAVDEEALREATAEVERLTRYQEEAARLQAAQEQMGALQADIHADQEQREAYQAQAAEEEARFARLREEVKDLDRLRQDLQDRERTLAEARRRLAEARDALGAARQRVAHCQHLRDLRKQKQQERERAAREQALYEELDAAFGKQGVQALLIDQALPEITEEANRLLSRMTDGRMRVDLQTQRETKSGTTQEVLDILISDELGCRPYELYSGGEAFRANFALRVALSRLLARRAGARLQTLFIDEGFGALDTVGRERLMEAIGSIQDDFACILVVTHVEELKEMFPVRIEVTKGEEGSRFVIR